MDLNTYIPQRTSRRSYTSEQVSAEHLSEIQRLLDSNQSGPFGSEIHFDLVNKHKVSAQRIKLGTYGFIQGARHFIAGQVRPSKDAFLDYGYALEKIILELTAMGLGTCWLGGTFERSEFEKAIDIKAGWVIPAITPFGHATASRGIGDRIIRAGAGSKKRKSWEELFFDKETLKPINADTIGSKAMCLEMLRIAPSASNNQPWRVLVSANSFDLYLSRKPGYNKMFGSIDIQMIDMGIAICHLDLAVRKEGGAASWSQIELPGTIFDWEYIKSVSF